MSVRFATRDLAVSQAVNGGFSPVLLLDTDSAALGADTLVSTTRAGLTVGCAPERGLAPPRTTRVAGTGVPTTSRPHAAWCAIELEFCIMYITNISTFKFESCGVPCPRIPGNKRWARAGRACRCTHVIVKRGTPEDQADAGPRPSFKA